MDQAAAVSNAGASSDHRLHIIGVYYNLIVDCQIIDMEVDDADDRAGGALRHRGVHGRAGAPGEGAGGGFNWTQAFLDLLLQVGAARILFSTDHPYASMEEARAFLDGLPVSTADRERIAHGNAECLLGL
jgi:Amidohydrolase